MFGVFSLEGEDSEDIASFFNKWKGVRWEQDSHIFVAPKGNCDPWVKCRRRYVWNQGRKTFLTRVGMSCLKK